MAYTLYFLAIGAALLMLARVTSLTEVVGFAIGGIASGIYWILCFQSLMGAWLREKARKAVCISGLVMPLALLVLYIVSHSRIAEIFLSVFLLGGFVFFGTVFMRFTTSKQ